MVMPMQEGMRPPPSPYLTEEQFSQLTPAEQDLYRLQMHDYVAWMQAIESGAIDMGGMEMQLD